MIIVVGDLMLDIFLLPELVREEQGSGLVVRGGGSAANTAAWIAQAGETVTFVGCAGNDPVGSALVAELEAGRVVTRVRSISGAETGCVAVEVTDHGERVMRSARGANEALSPDDIGSSISPSLNIMHLTGYALLAPDGLALLRAASDAARSAGALLSFDPSSSGVIDFVGAKRLLTALHDVNVSLFLPNVEEALRCCGTDDIEAAAKYLSGLFPSLLIKSGASGAIAMDAGVALSVPVAPLRPIDTTGAGDAFNAGALLSLLRGGTPIDAAHSGNRVAAQAIRHYGGRPVAERRGSTLREPKV